MAGALVSIILEQLASVTSKQMKAEVKLVAGVDDEVQKLTRNFRSIRAVLDDAESKQFKDLAVRNWLDKLKDTSYDMDDVLDEWITRLGVNGIENASKPKRKLSSFMPSYWFSFGNVSSHHDIAVKIKELNRKLEVIAMEKSMFNFSLAGETIELKPRETASIIDDESNIHGRDHDKDTLLKMLSENSQAPAIPIISVVGMGGIGKTTLARLAFNDNEVKTRFDKRIWVCVSKPFDEIKIAKSIFDSVVRNELKPDSLQAILERIEEKIRGKKIFFVLDDVWSQNPNDWEQLMGTLKCGSQESRILVTTRNINVAKIIGTANTNVVNLGLLLEEESWSLFSKIVFSERTSEEYKKLEDIGRQIIGKCKGLPLAIKTLASLLRLKSSIKEWQNIVDSEMWELEEAERGIFPPLLLSYHDLSSTLKECFSYCAIFPKDFEFEKDKLIKLWMAQGYFGDERIKDMEIIGEECFENLAMRSFFQDFWRDELDGSIISCKMHDIVHDFAQFLTKNECFNIEIDDAEGSQVQFSFEKGRHLRVGLESGDTFPMSIYNAKKLRSLVVKCENVSNMTLLNFFENFVCLRTLELNNFNPHDFVYIKEVPREIKNLIHLRYLDLSNYVQLEELPETLCELYNLQTLNINNCEGLKKLPQEMGKLINLRHLMNNWTCYWSVKGMPKGIEGLIGLRTLTEFSVCRNREGSGLEYLKNLNNLRGSLTIFRLGDVGDVGEVNKANLMNKTNLLSLGLTFRRGDEVRENRDNGNIDEAVFEALQPPPNLERLEILCYEGKTLSLNWRVSLTKVRFLRLYYCKNLEEWDISKEEGEDVTIIMPSLNSLKILDCNKLKSLPDHILQTPTLKKLDILGCPILKERYNKKTGVDWIKISHIPNYSI